MPAYPQKPDGYKLNRQAYFVTCSSGETKAEMIAAWREKGAARELLRSDLGHRSHRRTLTEAVTRLERGGVEAVQRFFEDFVGQLEIRIRDGDPAGFYKHGHGKAMDLEGRRSCSV